VCLPLLQNQARQTHPTVVHIKKLQIETKPTTTVASPSALAVNPPKKELAGERLRLQIHDCHVSRSFQAHKYLDSIVCKIDLFQPNEAIA
jgi:hypothetical protein